MADEIHPFYDRLIDEYGSLYFKSISEIQAILNDPSEISIRKMAARMVLNSTPTKSFSELAMKEARVLKDALKNPEVKAAFDRLVQLDWEKVA